MLVTVWGPSGLSRKYVTFTIQSLGIVGVNAAEEAWGGGIVDAFVIVSSMNRKFKFVFVESYVNFRKYIWLIDQNILLLKLILYSVNGNSPYVLTQISSVIAIEDGWSAEGTCFCRLGAKQPMPLAWMWLICTVFIISNDTPAIHSKLIKIFELLFICVCIWFWSY